MTRKNRAVGLAVAFLTTVGGCKGTDGDEKKRDSAKKASERVIGTWEVDVDRSVSERLKNERIAKRAKKYPDRFEKTKKRLRNMTVTVTADTIVMDMGRKKRNLTYKVLEEKGDKVTLETTRTFENGQEHVTKLIFEFRDGALFAYGPRKDGHRDAETWFEPKK